MKILERLWRALLHLSPLQQGVLIFTVGLAVRLLILFVSKTYRDLTHLELERTAISLITTGVYGNPYAVSTGPSAHVAPGYTLILAAIFRTFGTGIPGEIAKRVLASAVSAFVWALLPWVAGRFSIEQRAGILAGVAGAIYPARPLVEMEGDWETPYTALALVLVAVISVALWSKRDLRLRQAVWQGLAWGVSLLFVPALLDIFVIFAGAGLYFCRKVGVSRYLTFAAVEVLVIAACLAPWVIRNKHALGAPVITRTNLGLELRISNNDQATPDQRINYLNGLFHRYHPLLNKPEARKVRQMGEIAYNKQAGDEARQWIRTHPMRFLELSLGRARCYWLYYDPTSLLKTALLALTSVLGFVGLVYLYRENQITGVVSGLILLLYPAPNYLVHVGLRQEYPIHWLMSLLAALTVLRWVGASRASAAARLAAGRADHGNVGTIR